MPTHASALAIGHRLQEYIIGRLLGHGGFGLTYLAQDSNLNSLVAIKEFLPQEFAVRAANNSVVPKSEYDAESYSWGLERFKEEARALARFKHPNIVRVSRLLEANGTAYMVMDFEPGMTLSQYLKRHGPTLDEGRLLGLFLPVLDGLEALHRLQLVHRDIKPSNIYVRAYGGPMLIDFGAVRQAIGAQSRSLTSLVTPGYAPIEQYSSDGRQGAWSDLYAVGASIYYCMFGHPPADAARRSAAISDGSEDPYSAANSRGGDRYSRELLECVDWALQFRVRDRPQSAHEFRERMRTSPVPPQVIEVPESLEDVPELQHGVMSAPTMPASSRVPASLGGSLGLAEGATVLSAPTEHMDSLSPLIEGTRRRHPTTELLPPEPWWPRVQGRLGGLRQRWNALLEKASREPHTLTGRIAQQLKEPPGMRIALSAAVILVVVLSLVIYARRTGGDDSRYQAALAAGTPAAYEEYLQGCRGCAHRKEAETALAGLKQGALAAALKDQFKELLAKKRLAAPAQPNAGEVLAQLEAAAPGDPYLPEARSALAEALKLARRGPREQYSVAVNRPRDTLVQGGTATTTMAAANEVMPKALYAPPPKYPQGAKGQSGWVDVEFTVNVDGSTSGMEVVGSSPKGLFDDAALHTVHQWIYSPYSLDGRRQSKRIRVRVLFKP